MAFEPVGRSGRWALRVCIGFLVVTTLAATGKVLVNVLQWRGSFYAAEAVLRDPTSDERQVRHAIIVIQREARRGMALLREQADGDSPNAIHARNALKSFR
jgi:hypothetical protein